MNYLLPSLCNFIHISLLFPTPPDFDFFKACVRVGNTLTQHHCLSTSFTELLLIVKAYLPIYIFLRTPTSSSDRFFNILLTKIGQSRFSANLNTMCEYTKNYYIYTSCVDPGAHFFGTSVDGKREYKCERGPHERYIVVPGHCPLCG